MSRIAFVGLGKMGSAMATRLLQAGHQLTVYNRTPSKADALVSAGAQLAATPREACANADAIFSMTADDCSSRAMWLGDDGILTADPAPGTFAIECSTLSYDWVMDLAARCTERRLRYLDAPVTGLPEDAAAGALTLLIGANPVELEAAHSLLAPLSRNVIRFGPIGAGTTYKLIVNLIGAVQIASAAEGLAMAERAGLDLNVVADALATSQAASPQVVRNVRRMAEDDHDRNIAFTPVLRLKDVEYALQLAQQLGIAAPFGTVARDALRQLCKLGYGQVNESKIIAVYGERAGSSP
jgi:3-hydroxyisobutyrate dehydrogenase